MRNEIDASFINKNNRWQSQYSSIIIYGVYDDLLPIKIGDSVLIEDIDQIYANYIEMAFAMGYNNMYTHIHNMDYIVINVKVHEKQNDIIYGLKPDVDYMTDGILLTSIFGLKKNFLLTMKDFKF